MKKGLHLFTLLVLAAVATGCASGVKYTDMQSSLAKLKPESGRIFFYRTAIVGAAVQPTVYLNDEKVGKAVPQGFFYLDKEPGEYKARASTEVKRTLSFTLEPGQTRYIRLDVNLGLFVGHVSPVLVEEEKAKKELQKCKYTGPKIP